MRFFSGAYSRDYKKYKYEIWTINHKLSKYQKNIPLLVYS